MRNSFDILFRESLIFSSTLIQKKKENLFKKTAKINKPSLFSGFPYLLTVLLVLFIDLSSLEAARSLTEAFKGGKISLDMRNRYEKVDETGKQNEAHATTLRTRLGYETGNYLGFLALVEFENITYIGGDRFDSTKNGRTNFPTIPDPEDTEVNQAYLSYQGFAETTLRWGRQRLILDNHRFLGNVGWRQNEQTFDAFFLQTRAIPNTMGTYIHLQNVNRIFGDHHPTEKDISMNTHLINISMGDPLRGFLTGYAYLLAFDETPLESTKTFGVRLTGIYPLNQDVELIYSSEYASQSEYADGNSANDASYLLGELGGVLGNTTLKVSYEELGGDGIYGFSTPLATHHIFQGWTDRFTDTPNTGIRDLFYTLSIDINNGKLTTIYHEFSSEQNHFNYGTEIGVMAYKTFMKHYAFGIKYATYSADQNSMNMSLGGAPATNVEKLWIWAQFQLK